MTSGGGANQTSGGAANDTVVVHGPRCIARFDYEGEERGDLSFMSGDVIRLTDKVGDDWLKGEVNGKVGIFPIAFVEIIEDLQLWSAMGGGAKEGDMHWDTAPVETGEWGGVLRICLCGCGR